MSRSRPQRAVLAAGALVLAIAPFLPWIRDTGCRGWVCYAPISAVQVSASHHPGGLSGWHVASLASILLELTAVATVLAAVLETSRPAWSPALHRALVLLVTAAGAWAAVDALRTAGLAGTDLIIDGRVVTPGTGAGGFVAAAGALLILLALGAPRLGGRVRARAAATG